MKTEIEEEWVRYFRTNGYPEASGLAAGMEGAVYCLIPGSVIAKVWKRRPVSELKRLMLFYEDLRRQSGSHSIRTPEVLSVELVDGIAISKERFLDGTPLERAVLADAQLSESRGPDAIVEVLRFLRSIDDSVPLRGLGVLSEEGAFWNGASRWSEALASLMFRRLARFRPQLRRDVEKFELLESASLAFLRGRDQVRMSLVHGDLCGANVLVDASLRPVSVLDFGFLSTVGDPAFDASIASAIYSMYDPDARDIDDALVSACVALLGYSRHELLCYRAIYAMISSNAYSADGSDGHYRWCVNMLRRLDVQTALGL